MKNILLILILISLSLTAFASNQIGPTPTHLSGIYSTSFFSNYSYWVINENGTGFICGEKIPKKIDLIFNGNAAYINGVKFEISEINDDEFTATGARSPNSTKLRTSHFKKGTYLPNTSSCKD